MYISKNVWVHVYEYVPAQIWTCAEPQVFYCCSPPSSLSQVLSIEPRILQYIKYWLASLALEILCLLFLSPRITGEPPCPTNIYIHAGDSNTSSHVGNTSVLIIEPFP